MFAKYPKQRPAFPKNYQYIFNRHYLENREGAFTASWGSKYLNHGCIKK
jgi:hypothetical protein